VSAPLKYWIAFLFVSFAISVLTLSFVHIRLISREGWRVFRMRSPVQLYWRELSSLQRWLLWPGIAAFFITWCAGVMIVIVRYITGNGANI
jgi:hypothetical protein